MENEFQISILIPEKELALLMVLLQFELGYTLFFISNAYFSTQPQRCLTLSGIKLRMLLRCCLIHKSIIILRHSLYLLYFCTFLDLVLFMSDLCDLFFIVIFIFVMINHIMSGIQTLSLLLIF